MNKNLWVKSGAVLALGLSGFVDAACDRTCLEGVAEKYLAALVTHDPSRAPIARNVRYTENGVELPLPDGLWRTAGSVGPYRLFVSDPETESVGFFVKVQENGAPALAATRLKVVRNQITEIESVVARLSGTIGGSPPGLQGPDQLGDRTREQFVTALPPDKRRKREELIRIVDGYFTGLENNTATSRRRSRTTACGSRTAYRRPDVRSRQKRNRLR